MNALVCVRSCVSKYPRKPCLNRNELNGDSLSVGKDDDEDGGDAADDDDDGQGQQSPLRVSHGLHGLLNVLHDVWGTDLQDASTAP